MRRLVLSLVISLVACLSLTSSALAAGLGFYGSVGGGSADWSTDSSYFNTFDFDKDTSHIGFGLALDTAPARDKLFNYQLNIGYDRFSNAGGSAWGNAGFDDFVISNNFGFGGMISRTTRVWFGPELRVTWGDGHPDKYSDYKIRLFGLGIGPVIGMNLNYDDLHTLVLKMGFQYINYVGEGNGRFSHTTNSDTTYSNSYDYEATEKMLYVTIEYLFRTSGDR